MNFEYRKSFLNISPKSSKEKHHLWIISSDPSKCPEKILILKVNKWRNLPWTDNSCLLFPQDHEFIDQKSFINYNEDRVKSISYLRRMDKMDNVKEKEEVSKRVMNKIHKGAKGNQFLSDEAINLLQKQNFI